MRCHPNQAVIPGFQNANQKPAWKINRGNTDGLFPFDGELKHYRNWVNRIRDHAADEWPQWRFVIDHAAACPEELSAQHLQGITLSGVSA